MELDMSVLYIMNPMSVIILNKQSPFAGRIVRSLTIEQIREELREREKVQALQVIPKPNLKPNEEDEYTKNILGTQLGFLLLCKWQRDNSIKLQTENMQLKEEKLGLEKEKLELEKKLQKTRNRFDEAMLSYFSPETRAAYHDIMDIAGKDEDDEK